MGGMTLGCLLGQYDRAQSFDVNSFSSIRNVNSWGEVSAQSSLFFDTDVGRVNSSFQGLRADVYSTGGGSTVLRYRYGRDNDAYEKWFPDVNTHDIRSIIFCGGHLAVDSGDAIVRIITDGVIIGDSKPIPNRAINVDSSIADINPIILTTTTFSSDDTPWVDFVKASATVDGSLVHGSRFYIDDILTQIDPINLNPDRDFGETWRLETARHETLGFLQREYTWHEQPRFRVPLGHVSALDAAIINRWWRKGFKLLYTMDTSDARTIFICRLVGQGAPMRKLENPYTDEWAGNLQLDAVDTSLVF